MKSPFLLLLALYFLIAACYPCSDDEICADDVNKTEISVSDAHEHAEDEIDGCSPFCVCNCCRANLHPPKNYSFNVITVSQRTDQPMLFLNRVEEFSYAFWQPPKI